jgi:hypothetical protein
VVFAIDASADDRAMARCSGRNGNAGTRSWHGFVQARTSKIESLVRNARHNMLIAGQIGKALVDYEAALSRGEKPEITSEVFAMLAIKGLSYGKDILFADEARKLDRQNRRRHK